MNQKRVVTRMVGLAMVVVWLPLLVGGIASLRTRGRLGESDTLIVSGPYAYVRHPLYAGLSMTAVGLGLVLGRLSLVLGGSAWLLVTRLWSIREEGELAERFGPEYAAYRESTPAFIPDLARVEEDVVGGGVHEAFHALLDRLSLACLG